MNFKTQYLQQIEKKHLLHDFHVTSAAEIHLCLLGNDFLHQ